MDIMKSYAKAFGKYKAPKLLRKLAEFEEHAGEESFSESFYLDADDDLQWYSDTEDEAYFSRLFRFAHADGTGASYAFWLPPEEENLKNAPIIYFGSEGNITLVAKNLKGLIRLLSFGPECMDGSFYKDTDDFEMPINAQKFRLWMKRSVDIKPIKDIDVCMSKEVDKIIKKAQDRYKKAFDAWQYQFYVDPEVEKNDYEAKENARLTTEEEKVRKDLTSHPHDAELYVKLASIAFDRHDKKYNWESINSLYEKALELDENHAGAIEALAERYEFKNIDRSIVLYEKLLNVKPEDTTLYRTIANLCVDNEDSDKASHYFALAVRLTDRQYLRADLKEFAKSHKKACKKLIEALADAGIDDKFTQSIL